MSARPCPRTQRARLTLSGADICGTRTYCLPGFVDSTRKTQAADSPRASTQRSSYRPGCRSSRSTAWASASRPLRNQVRPTIRLARAWMMALPARAMNLPPAVGERMRKSSVSSGGGGMGLGAGRVLGGGGSLVDLSACKSNKRASSGSAASAPTYCGAPLPLNRPTQTPIANRWLWPTAQASRRPELVPVFHMNQGTLAASRSSMPCGRR